MEELTVLRAVGHRLDPATGTPPPELRNRVVAGFATGAVRRPAGHRPTLARLALGWRLVLTGGVAAALLAGLAVAVVTTRHGSGPPGAGAGGNPLVAANILLRAAQTARSERSTVPRPNQFVYTRSRRQAELDKEWAPGKDGLPRVVPGVPRLWETWASVDGTRDGLQLVEPSLGYPTLVQGCPPGGSCVPQPAYRPDLPTDSTAMLAYLRSAALERSKGDPAFAQIFVYEVITGLLNGYLTPSQRGALFEAASRLPGSVVVPDVVDAAGRHGIAVAQSLLGYTEQPRPGTSPPPPAPVAQNQLIFDPTSYAYLGSRTVSTTVVDGKPAGTVTEQNAVLQTAIVDRAGQRP